MRGVTMAHLGYTDNTNAVQLVADATVTAVTNLNTHITALNAQIANLTIRLAFATESLHLLTERFERHECLTGYRIEEEPSP